VYLLSGLSLLVIVSGLAAALVTLWLFVSARGRTGERGRAYRLMAVGAGTATLTMITALVGVGVLTPAWDQHRPDRSLLATVVAVGFGVSGVLLCWCLLRLSGVAESRSMAARHLLDALVVAAAVWFVGWVLCSPPTRLLGDVTMATCPAILLSASAVAFTAGVSVIIAIRWSQRGYGLALSGAGALLVGVSGAGAATGICHTGPELTLFSSGLLPAGLGLLWYGGRRSDCAAPPDVDLIRRGTAYAFLPMVAMAAAGMYHVIRLGEFTTMAIAVGSLEGFALASRQYVALLDVRRYAGRLAEREAHFRNLAHTDPLTGLANRRALLGELHDCFEHGRPAVLLALDLDGFKIVNDMRGHQVGDGVLVEVARRLARQLGPAGMACRLGGDEFAVLLPLSDAASSDRAAHGLLRVLNEPYDHDKGDVYVSVSIGVACRSTASDVPMLLRNADLALRYAKQRGKNRVEMYDAEYDQGLRRRTTLEHELRGAVDRGELRLVFQPVVAVPSVRPVGTEALIRWRHPMLGTVRPDEFIPLAEECGMISKLGAWVLDQACQQLSRWLADGHDVWVSVNVSPRELHAPEYVTQVDQALRRHRVPAQRLVLEVTEHAVATDLAELIRRLEALRATGVRIALDDFGAGYSSLGQLRDLPIDILKIDHSLVAEREPAGLATRRRAFAPMVDVVTRLGHQLGLEVIAEGVTNQAELAVVVEAGCRFGQGALFGWGVPAEHLEAMLDAASSPGARRIPGPRAAIDPVYEPDGTGSREARNGAGRMDPQAGAGSAMRGVQDVRSVDSSHELRQA